MRDKIPSPKFIYYIVKEGLLCAAKTGTRPHKLHSMGYHFFQRWSAILFSSAIIFELMSIT